ncbi:MAG TPA: hypothetical protein VGR89_05960 [Puia sp.]|nr:hypothetical protein [Puia sp.]
MPNPKTDSGGFSTDNADQNRDMGSKGGPSTTLGSPDDHHGVPAPYDSDLQTQIAAKGHKKNKEEKKEGPNCDD